MQGAENFGNDLAKRGPTPGALPALQASSPAPRAPGAAPCPGHNEETRPGQYGSILYPFLQDAALFTSAAFPGRAAVAGIPRHG